eukprot:scaffold63219_cov33-Tisochrysis_lutea.AAC.5
MPAEAPRKDVRARHLRYMLTVAPHFCSLWTPRYYNPCNNGRQFGHAIQLALRERSTVHHRITKAWESIPLLTGRNPAFCPHHVAAKLAVEGDQLLAQWGCCAIGRIRPAECDRAGDLLNAVAAWEHVLDMDAALRHLGLDIR